MLDWTSLLQQSKSILASIVIDFIAWEDNVNPSGLDTSDRYIHYGWSDDDEEDEMLHEDTLKWAKKAGRWVSQTEKVCFPTHSHAQGAISDVP